MSSIHPRPICANHLVEMEVAKNGVTVRDRETRGFQSSFWQGDKYECPHPDCPASVITGFGKPYLQGDEDRSVEFSYGLRSELAAPETVNPKGAEPSPGSVRVSSPGHNPPLEGR